MRNLMTIMVGLIIFMDDIYQFELPLFQCDALCQLVFCRIIFCHFSILFSAAKIYNYLNCSILFLVKKINSSVSPTHSLTPPPRTPHGTHSVRFVWG